MYCMFIRNGFFGLSIELKIVQHCYNPFRIIKEFLVFYLFFSSFFFFSIVVQSHAIQILHLLIVTLFFFSRNFKALV